MALETPQTTPHPVDPPDPVILSKNPESTSSTSVSPADFACLLDSQALGESILKRHLTDLNARPEPPSTDATTYAILSLRRTTENRRKIMLMINPDAFRRTPRTNPDDPSPHETPRAWRHTKTFYPDPHSPSERSAPLRENSFSEFSELHSSNFALHNSPPPIAVHANPYLLNPNADDDYDPNDDLDDPELDADLTGDFSDPVNPPNPGILSKNPPSDFSNSPFAIRNLSDPAILSKSSSSVPSVNSVAPCENSSSTSASQSLFGLSPEDSRTLASILEPCHNAPRQLRPVPEKYEGMTIEEYNAYCDFNDSGHPMDYLKPEVAAHNKRFTDYLFRDRSLDPKPESTSPANPSDPVNPSPDPEILSKNSSSAPRREKSSSSEPLISSIRSRAGPRSY